MAAVGSPALRQVPLHSSEAMNGPMLRRCRVWPVSSDPNMGSGGGDGLFGMARGDRGPWLPPASARPQGGGIVSTDDEAVLIVSNKCWSAARLAGPAAVLRASKPTVDRRSLTWTRRALLRCPRRPWDLRWGTTRLGRLDAPRTVSAGEYLSGAFAGGIEGLHRGGGEEDTGPLRAQNFRQRFFEPTA